MKVDLHMHSAASDGTDAPEALAALCRAAGLTHAVLTDHDTMAGTADFLAAARVQGIRAVSGIEFSAEWEGELHILVYGADTADAALRQALCGLRQRREERMRRMVEQLRRAGVELSYDAVQRCADGASIGRPHLAQALCQAGYAASIAEAFAKYLTPGQAGYVPRQSLSVEEILAAAQAAGGLAVLAHPGLTQAEDYDALFARLKAGGLQGVEAFYPLHSDAACRAYYALAGKHGLFVTQGSDFHGTRREARLGMEQRGADTPLLREGLRRIFEKKQP